MLSSVLAVSGLRGWSSGPRVPTLKGLCLLEPHVVDIKEAPRRAALLLELFKLPGYIFREAT